MTDIAPPAPWQSVSPTWIPRGLPEIWRAWLTLPDGRALALTEADIDVTWDASRSPRVTSSVVIPYAPIIDQLADPRGTGVRLKVEAGWPIPQAGIFTLADLRLVSCTHDRRPGRITLTGASRESVIIDNASPDTPGPLGAADTAAAIDLLTAAAFGRAESINSTRLTSRGPAVTLDNVTDRWDTIHTLADAQGWRFFDEASWLDYRTGLQLTPAPAATTDPVADLRTGPDGTLTEVTYVRSRDPWANRILLTHTWTDTAGATQTLRTAAAATGAPAADVRTIEVTRRGAITAPLAAAAAQTLANRAATRGRAITATSGVNVWWIRPDDTVRITDRGLSTLALVDAVTMRSRGGMTITTRSA